MLRIYTVNMIGWRGVKGFLRYFRAVFSPWKPLDREQGTCVQLPIILNYVTDHFTWDFWASSGAVRSKSGTVQREIELGQLKEYYLSITLTVISVD